MKWPLCFLIALMKVADGMDNATTIKPVLLESTAAPNKCSSNHSQCSKNKLCVIDENFFAGYRCCRKSVCAADEGRYCLDPGNIEHATRIPSIRKRRHPFHPPESVVYTCERGYIFASNVNVTCKRNGYWTEPLPHCTKYSFPPGGPIHKPPTTVPPQTTALPTAEPPIALAVCGSVLVLLIAGFFAFCAIRKWRQGRDFMFIQNQSVVLGNNYKSSANLPSDLVSNAVAAEDFAQYVAVRHQGNDQRFNEEFESIQNCEIMRPTSEASMLPENKDKNRYTNIVAYDHSRVLLRQNRSNRHNLHRGSDYVNANYVSSYNKPKAYIACQGPLPATFNDFWKMIWENNTTVIVMITNLMEKGRRKCDQYWPQEGREQYKHVTVALKTTTTFANFTIRTFAVKNTKLVRRNARGGERKVFQFHFTQWPDHGTPEYLLPVLTFIRRSSLANHPQSGPIVVHCSAGVGRTGTYIVIHSMMQMLRETGKVNILGFLRYIRSQRNHLVQTGDQFVFVHDAILEYIMSGITERSTSELAKYFEQLVASNSPGGGTRGEGNPAVGMGDFGGAFRSGLEKQFMKVVYSRLDGLDYDIAARAVNEMKNRPGAVLPVFRSRVLLCNRTSAEGSDYINASFVQGYRSSHEFIVTQLPLNNTRKDFWQLIWDHNCPTIVTLIDEEWDAAHEVYWPSASHALHCSSFNVSFAKETSCVVSSNLKVTTRDFILEATKDDYVLAVKHFELSKWPTDRPSKGQLDALKMVIEYTADKDGTTVIQDRHGSTSAIQFACWNLLHHQMNEEGIIDVYQTAVLACQMRPRVFTSPSHLKFLYEAALMEAKLRADPAAVVEEASNDVKPKARVQKFFSSASFDSYDGAGEEKRLLDDEDSSSPQQSDKTEVSVVDDQSPADVDDLV